MTEKKLDTVDKSVVFHVVGKLATCKTTIILLSLRSKPDAMSFSSVAAKTGWLSYISTVIYRDW